LNSNIERLRNDIETLSTFNSTPGEGVTRFSYSAEDADARKYLIDIMQSLGLQVRIDAVGNIRARCEGKLKEAPIILTGSHIDTVLHGGKFDGTVGVVGGLEVFRLLKEHNVKTNHPLELVIFVEEEGSNFNAALAGSKILTGRYNLKDLKTITNTEGISMFEMAKYAGYHPEKCKDFVIQPGEIKAMIEMHIEQSAILFSENISIGIVEIICGGKWLEIEFKGISNHAGTTPMHSRNDPMLGAAIAIAGIANILNQKALSGTVATVGKIVCKPNVMNIIPDSVAFTVDIRSVDIRELQIVEEALYQLLHEVEKQLGLNKMIKLIGESDPIAFSPKIISILEEVAIRKRIKHRKINSGAIHDASMFVNIADVGMVFVPSKNGRSHVQTEMTDYEDIQKGCDLLLDTILKLDKI
jgi:allantoate deiminase